MTCGAGLWLQCEGQLRPLGWIRERLFVTIGFAIFSVSCGHADAATNSFFFATREACSASWVFNKSECANAFYNAEIELNENAPKFKTIGECMLRFLQCESSDANSSAEPEAQDNGPFRPTMLGVEISYNGNAGVATPVLAAVHPAGMFKARPISRPDVALPAVAHNQSQILRADRFEPFPLRSTFGVAPPVDASRAEAKRHTQAVSEQLEDLRKRAARREQLKAAPFIE